MEFFRERVEILFTEGRYPPELLLLEKTSMTLREAEELRSIDPERYYTYILFLIEKMKYEKKEIDKLKGRASGSSGETDTFRFREEQEEIPDDFVSEIGVMKDE